MKIEELGIGPLADAKGLSPNMWLEISFRKIQELEEKQKEMVAKLKGKRESEITAQEWELLNKLDSALREIDALMDAFLEGCPDRSELN